MKRLIQKLPNVVRRRIYRTLLVLIYVTLVPIAIVWEAAKAALATAREAMTDLREAWEWIDE